MFIGSLTGADKVKATWRPGHNFMIFAAKVGLAFSLSCAPVCVLAAPGHANRGPVAKRAVVRTEGRLLSAEEGITVLNAAREHQLQPGSKRDCSHLVHEVYTMVGLEYPFARSNDLYQGAKSFE